MRRSITVNHKSVTPLKEQSHQNYVWCDDAYTSKRKNYTDTDQPIAHLDFNTTINGIYGFELYEAAHVLTHMWADPQSLLVKSKNRKYTYRKYFNLAVSHILLSELYSIPVYIGESDFTKNWKVPSIIKMNNIVESTYADPLFIIKRPDIYDKHNFDNTLACGFFIVYSQGQPSDADIAKGHNCILFSMGPMRVLFVGWETMDNLYHYTPSVYNKLYKKTGITVCPEDLLTPIDFPYYTSLFNKSKDRYMLIHDWLRTEEYQRYRSKTPPLPCRDCLDLLPNIDGFPSRSEIFRCDKDLKKIKTKVFKNVRSYTVATELNIIGLSNKDKKVIYNSRSYRTNGWKSKMKKLRERYKRSKNLIIL